uniref:KRAB domain-containing protein n=1 Tax=Otus sunia TaxID=257818 RepID=A0A8C8ASH6_9STRI
MEGAILVWQEPVTFEDVAVYLSRAEWDAIAVEQKGLYCSVMLDNYKLLTSLGYPGPKPDILYRLERGEEPWVCTPQSPVRWDGSTSPSPGEEEQSNPCRTSYLAPQLGRRQTLSNPISAGGRCMHWRLRSRRLLNKFKCLGARSKMLAEAVARGMGPLESRDPAQTVFRPGKGEVENKQGVMANVTPLHPVMGQQNKEADPQEPHGDPRRKFQMTAQKSRHTLGEVTFLQGNRKAFVKDLNEIILEEHCYCTMGATQLLRYTRRPCPLTEHNYYKNHEVVLALKDHEYCQVPGFRYRDGVSQIVRLARKARTTFHRLAKRKSLIGRIIRKAKRIMWRFQSCISKRLEFPQGSSSASCLSEPAIPPAKAGDGPTKGTCGALCAPAEQETVPPQPQTKGTSHGVTVAALHAPVVCVEPTAAPPPSNAAAEVKMEATHLEVSLCRKVQRAQLTRSPHAERNVELLNSNHVSLHDAYKMVMWTVDQMLDSVCQNLEHGGCSRGKDAWPIVIQIDS